jgi:biopolymer transport protein TolR
MPKVQQHGGSGGGRRARGGHVATSLAEINVVPLVDVMLVLLIIFMITAPMMQQGLQVNLPQSRRADKLTAQPIYVTVPAAFKDNRIVQIGEEPVRVDILHERVKQAMLAQNEKSVFIRADATTTYQDLVDVTDRLKEAGVERVGLISRPAAPR